MGISAQPPMLSGNWSYKTARYKWRRQVLYHISKNTTT